MIPEEIRKSLIDKYLETGVGRSLLTQALANSIKFIMPQACDEDEENEEVKKIALDTLKTQLGYAYSIMGQMILQDQDVPKEFSDLVHEVEEIIFD